MTEPVIKITVDIFYADAAQCAEWDAQILAQRPILANAKDQSWRTQAGWYWRCEQLEELDGGPFETREECEADARRAATALGPEAIADALGDATHGLAPTPWGKRRLH